jgi:hypothetical protein
VCLSRLFPFHSLLLPSASGLGKQSRKKQPQSAPGLLKAANVVEEYTSMALTLPQCHTAFVPAPQPRNLQVTARTTVPKHLFQRLLGHSVPGSDLTLALCHHKPLPHTASQIQFQQNFLRKVTAAVHTAWESSLKSHSCPTSPTGA